MVNSREARKLALAALIPAILILSATLAGMFWFGARKTEILGETPLRQVADNLQHLSLEHAQALDEFFVRIESLVTGVVDYAEGMWEENTTLERTSYYHNSTITTPPDLEYSDRHQQEVSYVTSAYKVAPDAYSDSNTYLTAPDDSTFGQWSETVDHVINLSASLDLVFIPTYSAMDEILWVYMGFEEGLHRTYPYHGPFSKQYDPRTRPWYLAGLDTAKGEVSFTAPFRDITTGKIIVTAVSPVRDGDNALVGVVAIDFELDTIQDEVLAINLVQTGRPFLINRDYFVIAHPSESDLNTYITELETDNAEFVSMLNQALPEQVVQEVIDYGGNQGDQLVTIVSLNHTGLILGLAIPEQVARASPIAPSFLTWVVGIVTLLLIVAAAGIVFSSLGGIGTVITSRDEPKFCKHCEAPLEPGEKFCTNCGVLLKKM